MRRSEPGKQSGQHLKAFVLNVKMLILLLLILLFLLFCNAIVFYTNFQYCW